MSHAKAQFSGVDELLGEEGHGSLLGADEGGGAHGKRVGFGYTLPFQNSGYEGGREAVARANRVGYLNPRCRLIRHVAWSEDVAAIYATRQDQHLQIVFAKQYPAFVLKVDAGIAEHAADRHQFLVVYLEDVAARASSPTALTTQLGRPNWDTW